MKSFATYVPFDLDDGELMDSLGASKTVSKTVSTAVNEHEVSALRAVLYV